MGFLDIIKKKIKAGTDVTPKQPDRGVEIAEEKIAPKEEAVDAAPETVKAEPKIEPTIKPKAEPKPQVEPKKAELKKEALSQKVTSILRRKKEISAAESKEDKVVSLKKRAAAGQVLIRPLVTEKATLTETYIFEIQPTANKTEVAKAIEQIYGIKPVNVRIMNMLGKVVRWQYRAGQRKSWKKAIVRLPKGKTIDVYEGT